MIDADLLELLRCPATRQRLVRANTHQLTRLKADPRAAEPFDDALVREDGLAAYPVRGGIPILLADECITLA